jgi:hypothetical protein
VCDTNRGLFQVQPDTFLGKHTFALLAQDCARVRKRISCVRSELVATSSLFGTRAAQLLAIVQQSAQRNYLRTKE